MTTPALELRGITVRYGETLANDAASLTVEAGSVHALVGENGAGKSTLMHVAYGLVRPDAGTILVDGDEVTGSYTPTRAMARGIGMVHQHFMLVGSMTVAENIVLGREPRAGLLLDSAAAAAQIREVAERFGLAVDPEARLEDLSVGEKQRVEILKALWRGCDVLVLDEPTAVLTPAEVTAFFAVLRRLVADGMAVVLITHKLDEVLEIADQITVMRRGKIVVELDGKTATAEDIASAMVGRPVLLRVDKKPAEPGDTILTIHDLTLRRRRGDIAVDRTSFEVRRGEIVGIAGVQGNGQSELIEAIAGLRIPESGAVWLAGRDITGQDVASRFSAGLAHIPEDRHARGLILDFSVAENLILGRQNEFSTAMGLDRRRIHENGVATTRSADIRPLSPMVPARSLSGGNQQKVVIARELERPALSLLLASQPTRGVDVGAIERIHRRLIRARDEGIGVLLVSAELSELRALSDRVLVMYRGRIVGELDARELAAADAPDRIGALMTGAIAGEEEE